MQLFWNTLFFIQYYFNLYDECNTLGWKLYERGKDWESLAVDCVYTLNDISYNVYDEDYWDEYYKIQSKLIAESQPSNLNFGLFK